MNNLALRQAKNQIVNFLNGLPYDIEVKRLLVKDIYDEVRDEADRQILKENHEVQEALAEAKEEDNNGTGLATSRVANVGEQTKHSVTAESDKPESTD